MNDERVLITGGAGFIGSSLADHLVRENDVIVVDDHSLGDDKRLSEKVDHRAQSVLDDDLPTDVDVVFHLAALSSITDHEQNRGQLLEGIDTNVKGFVNVVEQARASGCTSIVYASSSAVYGTRHEPVSEDADISAPNAYAASKLARERYAEFFSNAHGMDLAGMRFFSVYQEPLGPRPETREATNIIAKLADDIANDRSPEVFGDGAHERDFIHVDDVVRGMKLAADRGLNGVYNLGTGKQYRINQVLEMLLELFGSGIDPTYVENPVPEHMFIESLVADSSKLKHETGWTPRVSLQDGLERIRDAYTGFQ